MKSCLKVDGVIIMFSCNSFAASVGGTGILCTWSES